MLVDGRFFSDQYGTDKDAFIINETAMKQFGWKNIDGKFLKLGFEDSKNSSCRSNERYSSDYTERTYSTYDIPLWSTK